MWYSYIEVIIFSLQWGFALLTFPRISHMWIGAIDGILIALTLQNTMFFLIGNLITFYVFLGVSILAMIVVSLFGF